jgi:hypothetical protein
MVRDGCSVPAFWEDMAMKASSLFATKFAVAVFSIVPLLCGSSITAFSQTGATTSLPNVWVDAPKQAARQAPKQHVAARSTASAHTSSTSVFCVGGCISSFKTGDRPWVGCSGSAGAYAYTGCRNIGPGGIPFKTYNECMENALKNGWRTNEGSFYCSSLALN